MIQNYLQILFSLLAITNPLLAITVYLNTTRGLTKANKKTVITICGLTTFSILIVFFYLGSFILKALSIHTYALELGGGIIILLVGITTILKNNSVSPVVSNNTDVVDMNRNNIVGLGVSPLTLPMIVGPGAIVMVVLFGDSAHTVTQHIVITLLIALLTIIIVVVLSLAEIISKFMGELGIVVMSKMFGLLLTAVAFDLIVSGIKQVVYSIIHGT